MHPRADTSTMPDKRLSSPFFSVSLRDGVSMPAHIVRRPAALCRPGPRGTATLGINACTHQPNYYDM